MKNNFAKLGKELKNGAMKHSPEILIALGITGMISTTVMAVKATPKALCLIEDEKRRINTENLKEAKKNGVDVCGKVDKLKPVEVVKTTWKCYVPAAVTGAVSVACIIGSNSVNSKRNAALATAYKLSETAFTEYKEQVIETVGEKKEQIIKEKVAAKKVERDPVSNKEVYVTSKGETLCYDCASGRYFKSDIETIKRAVNVCNKNMIDDMYVSLNDFYYEIGLKETKLGAELGWNMDGGLLDVTFSSTISEGGEPCIVLNYSVDPRYDFSKLM